MRGKKEEIREGENEIKEKFRVIDWQRRGRREELDEREEGGRLVERIQHAWSWCWSERETERGREGGWEERGKQREGVRYLNAGAGQHRRSSELPESGGRTGRGKRRAVFLTTKPTHSDTEILHIQAHTRRAHSHPHTFGLSTHLWTPNLSSGALPAPPLLPAITLLATSPTFTPSAPRVV